MKSLLKSLAIATMLIAPQVASAVELTCSAPIVYVGQQSRDAHDTVVGVDVYYSNGEWQVRHRMGNGSEVNRVNQYAMPAYCGWLARSSATRELANRSTLSGSTTVVA